MRFAIDFEIARRFCLVALLLLANATGARASALQDGGGLPSQVNFQSPSATPAPSPVAIVNYVASRMVADPVRPRVYATATDTNSVIVIDTNTLAVIKTIPIGSVPTGLAISADNSRLWVANSGSTNFAVGVIDLDTLSALPSLPAPRQPFDVVEGSGHRLYLTPYTSSYPYYGIMQIDSDTGQYQGSLGSSEVYGGGNLGITADRKALIFGNSGLSPSTLEKFDISAANGVLLQRNNNVGSNGNSVTLSHSGAWIVFPNGGGNGAGYSTFEIPTADITTVNCTFNVGAYPGPAAFSNDDTVLYHTAYGTIRLSTFETHFGTLLGTFNLNSQDVSDVVVDRSGQWLFVSTRDVYYGQPPLGDIRIFSTGRTDLLQPFVNSVVSRKTHGDAGTFDVDLTGGNGIECRSGGANGDYTIIFTFANTLTSVGGANLRHGTGSIVDTAIDTGDAHNYVVNLTGVANAQTITVYLTNVVDSAGYSSIAIPVSMGVLVGDTTGNGTVNSSDIAQTQSQSGQPVTSDNFREDVTTNGAVNSSDIALVQSMSGTGIGSAPLSSGSSPGASSATTTTKNQHRKRTSRNN